MKDTINERQIRLLREIHECGNVPRTSLNTRTLSRLEGLGLVESYESESRTAIKSLRPKQARFIRLTDAGRSSIAKKAEVE